MIWTLPERAFEFLSLRVEPSHTILEFGSGHGSQALADLVPKGRLFSVEHDAEWIGVCGAATYIHAPIKDGWYDVAAIQEKAPPKYDCIVVDGPPGHIGRSGLVPNLELFADVPMLIDDVHRDPELEVAVRVAEARDKDMSIHYVRDRAFATLGWVL